jgi:hypothetical protein
MADVVELADDDDNVVSPRRVRLARVASARNGTEKIVDSQFGCNHFLTCFFFFPASVCVTLGFNVQTA